MPQVSNVGDESRSSVGASHAARTGLRGGVRCVADFARVAPVSPQGEESLVVDDRSGMSPAELVENKLSRMLKDGSMPISHLQMRRLLRAR